MKKLKNKSHLQFQLSTLQVLNVMQKIFSFKPIKLFFPNSFYLAGIFIDLHLRFLFHLAWSSTVSFFLLLLLLEFSLRPRHSDISICFSFFFFFKKKARTTKAQNFPSFHPFASSHPSLLVCCAYSNGDGWRIRFYNFLRFSQPIMADEIEGLLLTGGCLEGTVFILLWIFISSLG